MILLTSIWYHNWNILEPSKKKNTMLCDMKDTDATLGGEGFELAAGVPNICLAHVNV